MTSANVKVSIRGYMDKLRKNKTSGKSKGEIKERKVNSRGDNQREGEYQVNAY